MTADNSTDLAPRSKPAKPEGCPLFPHRVAEFDFPDNAWVGTTVDCQARVANAEKAFRKVRAGVKWPHPHETAFRGERLSAWGRCGGICAPGSGRRPSRW